MSTTIRKSLQVIQWLAHAKGPLGISELSRAMGMNKSAVQRILQTLHEEDYVEKAPGTSKYQLTLSIWELGSHVVARHEARRLLHPILRYGAQSSGLTSFLAYSSFPFVVYLDKVEGSYGRTRSAEPGSRVPMHRTAAGKAVLSCLPEDKVKELEQSHVDWTGHVKLDGMNTDSLLEELRATRARGYAISEGGLKPGVNSIAAPIWWRDEIPYGSLALTADAANLPPAEFARIGSIVAGMAEEATNGLGAAAFQRDALDKLG
ncbi:IclR family transcriptional regulator [Rhodovibrionaceae bacterium A322]